MRDQSQDTGAAHPHSKKIVYSDQGHTLSRNINAPKIIPDATFSTLLEQVISRAGIKHVGWDFDGTIAYTERLHRVICILAIAELADSEGQIRKSHWNGSGFRAAFGLPPDETSIVIASHLNQEYPDIFSRFNLDNSAEKTVEDVARDISEKRREIFNFYIDHAVFVNSKGPGDPVELRIRKTDDEQNPALHKRINALSEVVVRSCPFAKESIELLYKLGVAQGVCTSSPSHVVRPLLEKLDLMRYFKATVFSDCVPEGQHKPQPHPWKLLRHRLSDGQESPDAPTDDMIVFENSAGGAFSGMRAGAVTIVVAENLPNVIGKLARKTKEEAGDTSNYTGRAHFIGSLGKLVEKTEKADLAPAH
jgi:beta-phosphoglucomutase-like phosphatase (HAD superfamily)